MSTSRSGTACVPNRRPGGEFTVGVEEEMMLIDLKGRLLVVRLRRRMVGGSIPSFWHGLDSGLASSR